MTKTITIRNVPDELHSRLKERAKRSGQSLSTHLLFELRTLAQYPTMDELRERLATETSLNPSVSPTEVLRAMRGD